MVHMCVYRDDLYLQVLTCVTTGKRINSGLIVAIKKSRVSLRVKRPVLQHESPILQLLQNNPGMPVLPGYAQN